MDLDSPKLQPQLDDGGVGFEVAAPRRRYFEGEVPKTQLGFGYTIGLLVVAVAMIILPLIYLGLVLLAVPDNSLFVV